MFCNAATISHGSDTIFSMHCTSSFLFANSIFFNVTTFSSLYFVSNDFFAYAGMWDLSTVVELKWSSNILIYCSLK